MMLPKRGATKSSVLILSGIHKWAVWLSPAFPWDQGISHLKSKTQITKKFSIFIYTDEKDSFKEWIDGL